MSTTPKPISALQSVGRVTRYFWLLSYIFFNAFVSLGSSFKCLGSRPFSQCSRSCQRAPQPQDVTRQSNCDLPTKGRSI
jgi:hypothetical protein